MSILISAIFGVITHIRSVFSHLQVKRFLAVAMVGMVLLTTNVNPDLSSNRALGKAARDAAHQDGGQRPRTTREWMNEAEQDVPLGKRVQQITEDSAEAFKEFGSGYVEGAQKTAREAENGVKQTGRDVTRSAR